MNTQQSVMQTNQPPKGTTVAQEGKFQDAHVLDKKIPKGLVMKYQGNWYILKAGLEWKAQQLYPGYNLTVMIIERRPDYCLAEATFVSQGGVQFNNFGEASKANVANPKMHPYLLHLAITRAECRVLRMATAAGYSSYEEVLEGNLNGGKKELPPSPDDGKPAQPSQLQVIKKLGGEPKANITFGEAKIQIEALLAKK